MFTRTRHGADRAAKQLGREGLEAAVIHGARTQSQRDRALAHFADGEALVLVATDVAARGIHVDGVECVLHFDPPEDGKAYVHRSGRTARRRFGELSCALSISRNVKRSNTYNAKRGLMFKSWTLTWTDLVMSNLSIQNH